MEKTKIKSYIDRKGRKVKGHIRKKSTAQRLKSYAKNLTAGTILTVASWKIAGKPASNLAGKGLKTVTNLNVTKKANQALNNILVNKPRIKRLKSLLTPIVPLTITAYAGTEATKRGAQALGWAVDRNRKEHGGKIKIRTDF